MASDPLFILMAFSILLVLAILIFGLFVFTKGSEFNRKYANKIMRARLAAQAVAIALILLFIFVRRQSGG